MLKNRNFRRLFFVILLLFYTNFYVIVQSQAVETQAVSEDTIIYEGEGTIYPGANTNLETLAIENVLLYPAFSNSVTNYDAEVSNSTTELNILAIPEDEEAFADIVRDDVLIEGDNIITINVTAADGVTKKTFVINVYRRSKEEEESVNYNAERTSADISDSTDTEDQSSGNFLRWIIWGILAIGVILLIIL